MTGRAADTAEHPQATAAARAPGAPADLLSRAAATFTVGAPIELPGPALDELVEALRRAASGGPAPDFAGSPHTPLALPALGHLRRRVLALAHEAGDQEAFAESHGWLLAIEQVSEHLAHDELGRVANQLRHLQRIILSTLSGARVRISGVDDHCPDSIAWGALPIEQDGSGHDLILCVNTRRHAGSVRENQAEIFPRGVTLDTTRQAMTGKPQG